MPRQGLLHHHSIHLNPLALPLRHSSDSSSSLSPLAGLSLAVFDLAEKLSLVCRSKASSRYCRLRRPLTRSCGKALTLLQIRSILPFLLQNLVLVSNPNHVKVFLVASLFASENKPLLTGRQDCFNMSISLVTDCLSQMETYMELFFWGGVL